MKDFKDYKRFPIQLSTQNIMLIHLFSDAGNSLNNVFETIDMREENPAVWDYDMNINETAAKQFFDQLEGHYCDAFLKELILEATRRLNEHDIRRAEFDKKASEVVKITCAGSERSRAMEAIKEAEKLITQ